MTSSLTRQQALELLTAPGQVYELQTRQIAGTPLRVFSNAPPTLRELFKQSVSDQTFLVYEDERLSFAQAWQRSAAIAQVLVSEYQIRPGDRVAISMRNYPEWVLSFCAITSIGAIAVAMNAMWQPDEMLFALRDCGASVLIADRERVDTLARCETLPELRLLIVRPFAVAPGVQVDFAALQAQLQSNCARLAACEPRLLDELIEKSVQKTDQKTGEGTVPVDGECGGAVEGADGGSGAAQFGPDDPATIFYTSGSTGHPKGVVSTHRAVISALMSWELDAQCALMLSGLAPPEPAQQAGALLGIPLFHVTGSHAVFLASFRAQRKLVSMYKWDPVLAAGLIEREQLTLFIGPAAVTGDLVRLARETGRDLSSLLAVGGGGAPRAPEQVLAIESVFANALPGTGWGMTETNAIGTGIGGLDYLNRPASSGRCSAVMQIRVVSDDGRELPCGERGELQVRGTGMFIGYWGRPELNETVFQDGWFRTGDVAYLDEEGFLFIVDRIKELIIRGGENIGCGHVEAALLMHPQVHEAAVYSVPDERLGEEVGATIHADASLDPESLREFLAGQLARFEIPRYLRISAEPLPRTASGKILKRQLREQAILSLEK